MILNKQQGKKYKDKTYEMDRYAVIFYSDVLQHVYFVVLIVFPHIRQDLITLSENYRSPPSCCWRNVAWMFKSFYVVFCDCLFVRRFLFFVFCRYGFVSLL